MLISKRIFNLETETAFTVLEKAKKLQLEGKDIINLGIKSGPNVGKILRSIESWWVTNNFKPSRKKCLEKLKEFS